MDNHARRVSYVVQNTGMAREAAETCVTGSYALGLDLKFTPAQRRRLKRQRAADGTHRAAQRARRTGTAQRLTEHWGPAYGAPSTAQTVPGVSRPVIAVDEINAFLGKTATAREHKTRLFRRKSG